MSDADLAIRLVDAGKRFVKYEDQPMLVNTLRSLRRRNRRHQLWAVRHCTMDVRKGECVGVLGRNGSGKSTTLQMLAGVTAPTEGSVTVWGRVAPLVQAGVGFHIELTGRENVYVNGTILGMSRAEIDSRLDAIHDFSELGTFLDTPVKFYSSGMYVRLGFSVAVEAVPDILLVDEVLAVGDIGFQAKCFRRMEAIRDSGTTIVVVSHNIHQIRRLCERCVVMIDGRMVFDGPTNEAIGVYFETVGTTVVEDATGQLVMTDSARAHVTLDMLDPQGRPTRDVTSGQSVRLALDADVHDEIETPAVGVIVSSVDGTHVYTEVFEGVAPSVRAGDRLHCELELPVRLTTGAYHVDAGLAEKGIGQVYAWSTPLPFHVAGRQFVLGVTDLGATVRRVERSSPGEPPKRSRRRAGAAR